MIKGIGIDLVDTDRFRQRLSDELVDELFLPDEIDYCRTQHRHWENFAARFAAKEACFKALAAGLEQGLRWHDVEVVRQADGPVSLKLSGAAATRAALLGVERLHLSLSHSSQNAIAMVVAESSAETVAETNPNPEAES